jgi:hypothetical protein
MQAKSDRSDERELRKPDVTATARLAERPGARAQPSASLDEMTRFAQLASDVLGSEMERHCSYAGGVSRG